MLTELVREMLKGDRLALAKLFSLIESDFTHLAELLKELHPYSGQAYRIGVTGPPGAGKSTLIDGMVHMLRSEGDTVGVLAIDPTSSFTGGSVLADRIRMQTHSIDPGVFIRSLATRGIQGGLTRIIRTAIDLMDANGKHVVIVESVGVGQTEIDIDYVVDAVVVTLVPEAGDSIQLMKAGLMEIGDVFVINKSDRHGANRLAAAVKNEIGSKQSNNQWTPPVILTQAHKGEGIEHLHKVLTQHRSMFQDAPNIKQRRSQQLKLEFIRAVKDSLEVQLENLVLENKELRTLIQDVESGKLDPYSAASQLLSSGGIFPRTDKT